MKVDYLKQIAIEIAKNEKNEQLKTQIETSKEIVKQEIQYVMAERAEIRGLLNDLFPQGIDQAKDFYEKLEDFHHYLGFDHECDLLIGIMWAESYTLLPPAKGLALLELFSKETTDILFLLPSFPVLLSEIEIPVDFACGWFIDLDKKIGQDLAGGNFFSAIDNYAFSHPDSGLKMLGEFLSEEPDSRTLHLSAIILGAIRSASEVWTIQEQAVKEWDAKLAKHPLVPFRLCYYRSLITSFHRRSISILRLQEELTRMVQGSQEEVDEAFHVLYKCLLNNSKDKAFVDFAYQWFLKTVTPTAPALAKHHVVSAMQALASPKSRLIDITAAN